MSQPIVSSMRRYGGTNDFSWRRYLPCAKFKRVYRRRKGTAPSSLILHRVPVAQRPAEADNRVEGGHWEADLMMLSNKKDNLLVAQGRTSRFVLMALQPDKKAARTMDTQLQWFAALPKPLRKTLTQDNGIEFALRYLLGERLGMQTYFCNPRSPWQKGGIKNMNGRLHRYLPLKTRPATLIHEDINALACKINHTHRKCLDLQTPAEVFSKQLLHFKCEYTSPLPQE